MVDGYLDAVTHVQKLALRTRERYKAALDRFLDYSRDIRLTFIDTLDLAAIEDFVKWLRGQKRCRNGSQTGSRDFYKAGGIQFILSTCRTAFRWAARRRMLPPFADNPFTLFRIDRLRDPGAPATSAKLFSAEQEEAFFAACDRWQRPIFATLATYGLRVGELTHLLIEDIDLELGQFTVRSKPWLFWGVKTGRERTLPLVPPTRAVFEKVIGGRHAGFVFLNAEYADARATMADRLVTPQAFEAQAQAVVADLLAARPEADEQDQKRAVVAFCRRQGQTPEKRVRGEFLKLTARIGCPDFTRVHDLRHMFSSRAQAQGVNPNLVQEMLGHATLDMTKRHTHLGLETQRQAIETLDLGSRFGLPQEAS